MKIVVSSTGDNLDAEVDPRFGRCPWFIIIDPETMKFEAVANESAMAAGGAGIAAAQMVVAKGVKAALTGSCGPNATQVLSGAGVDIITGVSGKVKDAVQSYKSGKLKPGAPPAGGGPGQDFGTGMGGGMGGGMGRGMGGGMGGGMGRGMGRGMGKGMGGGMGGGMGRGMGRGMGMGMGGGVMMPPADPAFQASNPEIEALRKQLSAIERRLEQLEKKNK